MIISPNLFLIFSLELTYIIIQIIVGSFLLYKLIITKLMNLLPLILFFMINPIEGLFIIFQFPYIYTHITIFISNICLLFFTKYTFYRDVRSGFYLILGIVIFLKLLDFILKIFIPFSSIGGIELINSQLGFHFLFLSIISLVLLLSYLWLAYSSLNYYKSIKSLPIQTWVKMRYLILGISSVIISFNGIFYLFMPFNAKSFEELQTFIKGLLILIMVLIFSVGNLIAWMMPTKLKNYFNRNYKSFKEEHLNEKELMDLLKDQLSSDTREGDKKVS